MRANVATWYAVAKQLGSPRAQWQAMAMSQKDNNYLLARLSLGSKTWIPLPYFFNQVLPQAPYITLLCHRLHVAPKMPQRETSGTTGSARSHGLVAKPFVLKAFPAGVPSLAQGPAQSW